MRAVIATFLCAGIASISATNKCVERDYGKGSVVCVCSSRYCDRFERVSLEAGAVLVESSKDGKRFKTSRIKRTTSNSVDHSERNFLHIDLDTSKKFQKIIGFGGAFTDSAALNIASLTSDLRQRLIRDYFGMDGLEYNMVRVPIGGSDFSTHPYALNERAGDFELESFQLAPEDYRLKIPAIKLAQEVSKEKLLVFGSPWSAPAWLKTNSRLTGNGTLKGHPGGKYYQTWAKYLVKFVKEYEKQNVSIWGITVQNQPSVLPEASFINAMGFTPETYRIFITKNLGPALKEAGLNSSVFQLMIVDDNLPQVARYAEEVFSDPEAKSYVTGIASHWYYNTPESVSIIEKVIEKHPEMFVLSTEACYEIKDPQKDLTLGNWKRGEGYANDIIQVLNRGAAGWVDWNLALDLQGGPNWVLNHVDAPIIVNKTSNEYYKNPMFHAIGHFSKFLKPGSVRINSNVRSSSDNNVQFVTFLTPMNEIVVVALNTGDTGCLIALSDGQNSTVSFNMGSHTIATITWRV